MRIFQLPATLIDTIEKMMNSFWKHKNPRVWDDVTEVNALVVERAKNLVVDWQIANFPGAVNSTPLQ